MKNLSQLKISLRKAFKEGTQKFVTKCTITIVILICAFSYNSVKAQVSVNVNIGVQAIWGPVGYDYVDYYYLPEIDVFYYVPNAQFIYWQGTQQVFVSTLPASFSVNLYNTYKVVVNEPKPYMNHGYYVSNYAKYKNGGPKQNIIRDSNDEKYFVVKGHPKHDQAKSNNRKEGGNSKTQNKENKAPKNENKNSNEQQKSMKQEKQPERKSQPTNSGKHTQQKSEKQNQPEQQQPKENGGNKGKGH